MVRISIVGTGYVGLVTGTCLSDFGLKVTCVDIDKEKIENLKKGILPIYEPGLKGIIERNAYYKRLRFVTDIREAVENSDVIFISVGTPSTEDGKADLRYVELVAKDIGKYMNEYKVIVNKSTVPIGTGKLVKEIIHQELEKREVRYEFDIVSNPEFLREGSAIYDFTHPDRVVIGTESQRAKDIMKNVYRVLYLNETPFIETNIETAEMIKYASNSFLAMKITFINEIANLCERAGANVQQVARAMGRDGRISPKFLHSGPGYGGSCFPKDTRALVRISQDYKASVTLIEATIKANENQKRLMACKILDTLDSVKGKELAILGLSFKPKTDDMREAPSITIINELYKNGAKFRVYDPIAMEEARNVFKNIEDRIVYCNDEYDAIKDADALIIITEWNQFRNLDLDKIMQSIKQPYFFDLRNIYEREIVENRGFKYIAVGQ